MKKTAYTLLVFFNWVPFWFFVYANIPFKCLLTGLSRKPFWFLKISVKFLSPEVALYLHKSTIQSCMKNCCHIWTGPPSCYFICRIVGPPLAAPLEPLAHCWNVASLSFFFNSCVCYIFVSLLFTSKREHLWNKEECFLFHLKSSFHSWVIQILTFQIFKCHDVISMIYETHFTE